MKIRQSRLLLKIPIIFFLLLSQLAFSQIVDEKNNEKGNRYINRLRFHDPMYFSLGKTTHPYTEKQVVYSNFQISFRYELIDFNKGDHNRDNPSRGINFAYTQKSFWDLTSRSEPFFDSNYRPAAFFIYQTLGKDSLSWVNRIDLEGGYQHHSNGRDSYASRSTEYLYFKPTLVWRTFDNSYLFLSPRFQHYFWQEYTNKDVSDYWGFVDIELSWRADFGLQIETHSIPAKNEFTFDITATYPMDKIWKELNFYLMANYRDGAGETFLTYNYSGRGFLFGIALSR